MSQRSIAILLPPLVLLAGALNFLPAQPAPAAPSSDTVIRPAYTTDGKLQLPESYREWIFLSSGLDMSYRRLPGMEDHSMFDNVFVDPVSYREFLRTGTWRDGTQLVLETRGATTKGSINQRGNFQNRDMMGVEIHVKDTKRFAGGWAFFGFDGNAPAQQIPTSEECYSCHQQHAAVDTTFVQFYPTLLGIAEQKHTLSPNYHP